MKTYIKLLLVILIFIASNPATVFATITEDTAFNANVGSKISNGGVYYAVKQSDGKIILGGTFTTYDGTTPARLVRLNADGTPDTTFNTNLGTGINNSIQNITVLSTGKILVSGLFTSLNGGVNKLIVLLNEDGTEDTDFTTNLGVGLNGSGVYEVKEQSDGKIILGGSITSYNGNSRGNLIRINADGTEDTDFSTALGTGFNNFIRGMELQSSGKIVVAGNFTTLDGVSRPYITRLNSDGTEDATFVSNVGTGFNSFVFRSSMDTSENIFLGGNFTSFNGTATNYVVKLSVNGVIDSTFNTNIGTGSNDDLLSVRVLPSTNNVYLGGNSSMTTFDGNTAVRMARLSNTGTFDTGFGTDIGTGFNGQMQYVYPVDNEIYAMGTFTSFNGGTLTRFARFIDSEAPVGVPDTTPPVLTMTSGASAPVSGDFTVTITADENITGFDISDITPTNATLSSFVNTVASTTWTVLVTPTISGTVTLDIVIGAVTDTASSPNSNTSATTFSIASSLSSGGSSDGGSSPSNVSNTAGMRTAVSSVAYDWAWNNPFIKAGLAVAQYVTGVNASNPSVVSNTTNYTPEVCNPYLTKFIKSGGSNDSDEVKKLETFLNTYEGENLIVNGVYEEVDIAAVKRFQTRNSETLTFWNLSAPTGYVYITTQKAINKRYCEQTMALNCPYFTAYQDEGDVSAEVSKIKTFLNKTQGENLAVNNVFDTSLTQAIKRFQTKFKSRILTPWSLTNPTGRWYQSTKKTAEDVLGCFYPVRLDNGEVLE